MTETEQKKLDVGGCKLESVAVNNKGSAIILAFDCTGRKELLHFNITKKAFYPNVEEYKL